MDAGIRNLSVFAACAQAGGGQPMSDITAFMHTDRSKRVTV